MYSWSIHSLTQFLIISLARQLLLEYHLFSLGGAPGRVFFVPFIQEANLLSFLRSEASKLINNVHIQTLFQV